MEKKYQIFISSTYEDLKEERKKVQDTILEMYQFPIGMEMFSAADEEQWEIIKETIDSSDYYVLIIGHRYGSIIEDGEDAGISYTEKEFRYAVAQKIPILAFIIDNKVPIIPNKMEDNGEKKKKLELFISEVMTGRTVQWWTSQEDLASKVMNSLNKQFNRGNRPGWIRANGFNFEETQREFVEMSKKIRTLEEENTELRKSVSERSPRLNILVNEETAIKVPFKEYDTSEIDSEYLELSMDDIPEEAIDIIHQQELDEYNLSLPSKEMLSEYKSELRFYKQAMEEPFDIKLKICNDGNIKANDIYIEIYFPDEVRILEKRKKLKEPSAPSKKANPIRRFYARKNCIGDESSIARPVYSSISEVFDTRYLRQVDSPNKYFFNNDNSVSIRVADLMIGYTWSIKDEYIIVPKKKGVFEIVCNLVCEEYKESTKQVIEVTVE